MKKPRNAEIIAIVEPGVPAVVRIASPRPGESYAEAVRRQDERAQRIRRQIDRRIDGYNPEFLGAKPARAGEDY